MDASAAAQNAKICFAWTVTFSFTAICTNARFVKFELIVFYDFSFNLTFQIKSLKMADIKRLLMKEQDKV